MERLIIGESEFRRLLRVGALVAGIVSLVPWKAPQQLLLTQNIDPKSNLENPPELPKILFFMIETFKARNLVRRCGPFSLMAASNEAWAL